MSKFIKVHLKAQDSAPFKKGDVVQINNDSDGWFGKYKIVREVTKDDVNKKSYVYQQITGGKQGLKWYEISDGKSISYKADYRLRKLKTQDNHDTYYDDISYLAKDLVAYAEDTDPGSDYDRHEVADFLSDMYTEEDVKYIKEKMQTPKGFEKVMNSAYLAFIRTKRNAHDSKTPEERFNDIGREKGLSRTECRQAFGKYKEICGNRWDKETAIECITDIT